MEKQRDLKVFLLWFLIFNSEQHHFIKNNLYSAVRINLRNVSSVFGTATHVALFFSFSFLMWYLKENISVHYLQQRTIFSRVDDLVFLTCYLLSSSSSLPSLFFLTFPPLRGCQKHFFLNCLEWWRKRKIKISKLSGVAGLDELLDVVFFFFWKRGRTCEKLWHARVYRCATVLEAFWQH